MDLIELAEKGKVVHKHFLDDTAEEDPLMDSNCIQYRMAPSQTEGSMPAFRVVASSPEQADATVVTSNNPTITTSVQAVLASPLNGQFYVIGSPTDMLNAPSSTQRTIAPRTFALEPAPTQPVTAKEEKQGNRRATHNEVERRRRDNINNWIMKLSKLIPADAGAPDPQGGKQAQSKGGILAKACEYLSETRKANEELREAAKGAEELSLENERLTTELQRLQRENSLLRQQLQATVLPKPEIDFSM